MNNIKKLTFDKLIIELTRDCNMQPPCQHCFRGTAQKITLDKKYIDGLLNQTEIIGSLVFAGGEPTLCINEMKYILNSLYEKKFPLFNMDFVTNGLIFDEKLVEIVKGYSNLIKLCQEIGTGSKVDVWKHVVISVSLDKFHNHREIAEENLKKYQEALIGYAQVVKLAYGNIPRKEGNGKTLKNGICDLSIDRADIKRIELFDNRHMPLCPQYQNYKRVKPEQIIVCCEIYLNALGNLLISSLGLHEYDFADNPKYIICSSLSDDIYNEIEKYSIGKIDCCNLMKITIAESKRNPIRGLVGMKDAWFYMEHKREDDSDVVERDASPNGINVKELMTQAVFNPNVIDDIIANAKSRKSLDL